MSRVTEVNVLNDWTLSIDHFYSIIKSSLGEISSGGRYQIQATAIPLDVDGDKYEWFSRGIINQAFNTALEPIPAGEDLGAGLQLRTTLAGEYRAFLSRALLLVETAELDEEVVEKIDQLEVDIENLGDKEYKLVEKLNKKWKQHTETNSIDAGDVAENEHWMQGQQENYRLKEIRERILLKISLQIGLRDQQYENADHKAILLAYKRLISPAATMRYPRFEDTSYPENVQAEFNVVYFAGLDSWDSNLFINEYMMTPKLSLSTIQSGTFGKHSSEITKDSIANESIKTDWNHSSSVSYGPFSAKASVASHTAIEEDFKTATSMTVSVESLMAIPYNANTWFTPEIFSNSVIRENAGVFERWLGEKGSLRVIPTHLVVSRGMTVTFKNEQVWKYDYESDFKVGGSGSAKIFGIGFGGGGSYSKAVERQKVERRGHELSFSDGVDNVRIIGFHTVINPALGDIWGVQETAFNEAVIQAKANDDLLLKGNK